MWLWLQRQRLFEKIVACHFILPKCLDGLIRHHELSFKGKVDEKAAVKLFQTDKLPVLKNIEIVK